MHPDNYLSFGSHVSQCILGSLLDKESEKLSFTAKHGLSLGGFGSGVGSGVHVSQCMEGIFVPDFNVKLSTENKELQKFLFMIWPFKWMKKYFTHKSIGGKFTKTHDQTTANQKKNLDRSSKTTKKRWQHRFQIPKITRKNLVVGIHTVINPVLITLFLAGKKNRHFRNH